MAEQGVRTFDSTRLSSTIAGSFDCMLLPAKSYIEQSKIYLLLSIEALAN